MGSFRMSASKIKGFDITADLPRKAQRLTLDFCNVIGW